MTFQVTTLQARLVVADASAAIDFYEAALGAVVNRRFTSPDGKIVHAELALGPATFAVKDADDADAAPSDGATPVIMSVYFDDVSAAATSFLAAGGRVIYPVSDWPYGERGGRLADPFGHQWMVSQVIRDLGDEEIQQATDEMFQRSE